MDNLDFGSVHEYLKQRSIIIKLVQELRRLRPQVNSNWEDPADWVLKNANIHGNSVLSLTITLTPVGCEWASKGGCTMCGEFEGSNKSTAVSAMFHVAQFATAVSKYASKYIPEWLRIYQEGNFTNQNELEYSTQSTILHLASIIKGLRRITIESMAKYITKKSLQILGEAVANRVELEVGMGFEGENDVVRNVCVNKGETIDDYYNAVELLKRAGIRSLAYVLLKPPFLTEGEAIEEAILTIRLAEKIGFDAISLEPASLHAHSLMHALSIEGFYQLPWLWSVIKVAQSAHQIQDFRIGGVGFYPRPFDVAHNRHLDGSNECNMTIWTAIREYGKTRKLDLFKGLDCACKKEWEIACKTMDIHLRSRIDQQLNGLNIARYARIISKNRQVLQPTVKYTTAITGGTQYSHDRNDK